MLALTHAHGVTDNRFSIGEVLKQSAPLLVRKWCFMVPVQTTPSGPAPAVRDWLLSTAMLLRDRRAEPRNAAQFLLAQGGEWNPLRAPLAAPGRIADTARASLPLAGAMIHHCQGSLLLAMSGSRLGEAGELMWNLTNADLVVRPGPPWSVTGQSATCCPPPDRDVRFVVLSREHGHVLSVHAPAGDDITTAVPGAEITKPAARRPVRVAQHRPDRTVVSFDTAAATVHGPYSEEMLVRAAVMRDLLEAAAWYGALTRIADGLVATANDGGSDDHGTDLVLAETDALLGATWAAIHDAARLWERGAGIAAARHHTARSRTLARTSAATLLAGYVPDEHEHARRDPGSSEAREQLVAWMSRRAWTADIDVVARSLRTDGPSW